MLSRMIDKIGYTKPLSASRAEAKKRASSASGTQFADMLDAMGDAAPADPVASSAPVISNTALLGLQEVSEEEVQRKRAYKQGKSTLDALEQLRDGLLMGTLSLSTVQHLERMVATERTATTDPRLRAILDEIEVRAAVELAKLERASRR